MCIHVCYVRWLIANDPGVCVWGGECSTHGAQSSRFDACFVDLLQSIFRTKTLRETVFIRHWDLFETNRSRSIHNVSRRTTTVLVCCVWGTTAWAIQWFDGSALNIRMRTPRNDRKSHACSIRCHGCYCIWIQRIDKTLIAFHPEWVRKLSTHCRPG